MVMPQLPDLPPPLPDRGRLPGLRPAPAPGQVGLCRLQVGEGSQRLAAVDRQAHEFTDARCACLNPLTPDDRPGATLAILADLAPSQITEDDVTGRRADQYTDHGLLHLLAYCTITAIDLIDASPIDRQSWSLIR
jgi:hypothetical protein